MPANRLRNERWLDSLKQIHARGGSIEIAVERRKDPLDRPRESPLREPPRDLLWRVRLHEVGEDRLVIENPGAAGRALDLKEGTKLIGVMAIGQTRWMFHSSVVEPPTGHERGPKALGIAMPANVERCTRRAQRRISTAELDLPEVYAWHLRDPSSAVPAELACQKDIAERLSSGGDVSDLKLDDPGELRPDLGAGFRAELANLGGGGVGLIVSAQERSVADNARVYWMRIDLRPVVPAPLCVSARLAHSHIDAMQQLYAGMAFEFALNPSHKSFVASQIARYADHLQETSRLTDVPDR